MSLAILVQPLGMQAFDWRISAQYSSLTYSISPVMNKRDLAKMDLRWVSELFSRSVGPYFSTLSLGLGGKATEKTRVAWPTTAPLSSCISAWQIS
mmetsp:Transcript_94908/g.153052  ORF Transcript_94908/g.153052 Transcript_94908/m.153052 type:complete len:95 (-) Transcript_94908:716-1000(-)